MRTFACQRLYLNAEKYIKLAAVCINDEGQVFSYVSLSEETRATEWIGGVIFLSDQSVLLPSCHFKELLQLNTCHTNPIEKSYAWHISHYDFINDSMTPQSVIQRLDAQSIITL